VEEEAMEGGREGGREGEKGGLHERGEKLEEEREWDSITYIRTLKKWKPTTAKAQEEKDGTFCIHKQMREGREG